MSKTRSDVVTFRDVQTDYLLDGVKAVALLFENGLASRATLRRAVTDLKRKDAEKAAALEHWYVENIGHLGKGRTPPQVGDLRGYKVQQLGSGIPFLRLPLPDCKKGETVLCRYNGAVTECQTSDGAVVAVDASAR